MSSTFDSIMKTPTTITKFKLVFLGDQSVGKTSIINRFVFDTFDGKDHPTVGVDFVSKNLAIDDRSIRLQLWDTAGQERFRSLIPGYIRDSHVALVVYDVTSRTSFNNIFKWYEDIKNERGNDALVVLLGNKIDMNNRQVSTEEGEKKAKEMDALFCEVSAKTGLNVSNVFLSIAGNLPGNEANGFTKSPGPNNNMKLDEKKVDINDKTKQEKKRKCC